MTSAIDIINNPELDIPTLTIQTSATRGYSQDELAHFRIGHDDVEHLFMRIIAFGEKGTDVKSDVRSIITDAVFEDSIDKTNTFTLSVHDPNWDLLNTGALQDTIDLNPGGIKNLWYRLDGVSVSNDDLTLTFSTRNAVYLSYKHRPQKANRKKVTRAEFILRLIRTVKKEKIKFHCPQLHVTQQIAKHTESERAALNHRTQGFKPSDKITVGGNAASPTQRDVISEVIRAGVAFPAPSLVIVAAIMCVMKESGASNNPYDPNPAHKAKFHGAFQQNRGDGWPGTGDAFKDATGNKKLGDKHGGFYGYAIPIFRKNPNVDLGFFVATVQGVVGSTNPQNSGYAMDTNRHRSEANHAYNAWNTGIPLDDPGSGTVEVVAPYEFDVGWPNNKWNENYLEAIYRLADKVGWSFFWVKDTAYFMSEEDLFKAKARARLRRGVHGVENVSFEWDKGKKLNQMTVSVRMDKWVCPLGTVIDFDEGGPAQGRWLVTNIRRSMFNDLGEIVLSKPMKERKEPLEKTTKNVTTQGDPGQSSDGSIPTLGDWAYPLEKKGTMIGGPGEGTHSFTAPPNNWQSDNAVDIKVPVGTHVYAVDDGKVTNISGSYHDGSGRFEGLTVTITTKDNVVFYQHNSWRAPWVQVGASVNKGDFIAKTGKGGGVPHLHFACKNGNPVVLLNILPGVEPGFSGGVWPGKFIVTSPFGEERPGHTHGGCDVGVPYNTKCTAPFPGLITMAEETGFGTAGGMVHLLLEHDQSSLYASDKIGWGHAHNMQVQVGQRVKKGQVLAYSNGSPAHVHFVLIRRGAGGNGIDGNWDPFPFLQGIGSAYEH